MSRSPQDKGESSFQPVPVHNILNGPVDYARCLTLGYDAVRLAGDISSGVGKDFGLDAMHLREHLAAARTGLEKIHQEPALYSLGRSFPVDRMPDSVVRGLGFQRPPTRQTLLARLTAKEADGNPQVNDDSLLGFLYHYQVVLQQEQAVFQEKDFPRLLGSFTKGFRRAVRGGSIPASATPNLERFANTDVAVDDGFTTAGQDKTAFVIRRGNRYGIVFGPTSDKETEMHELAHVIAGEDESVTKDNTSNPTYTGMYRLFKLSERTPGTTALDEAVTDRIAHVVLGGHVEVVNPNAYTRQQSYLNAFVLNALTRCGRYPIDPRLFIAAQLENEDQRKALGDKAALERLGQRLVDAFPDMDILQSLAELEASEAAVLDFTKSLRRRHPIRSAVRRIRD